ncbi:MAG: DNA-deoxyinosine glycosylase [Muribaculaceae bacterium]|nr:DNA-deoxyinosine glycosylase [Muribaculaceae bacterium]
MSALNYDAIHRNTMADINRINTLIDNYFASTGLSRAKANEISHYLEKNGALSHSKKGQPLRKLLREGKIPNAEQPGGKGKSWYINRRNVRTAIPVQTLEPKALKSIELTSEAVTESLEPVANSESEFLILGTLPGEESLQTRQYYASHSNHFWRIISRIFDEAMPHSYEEKLNLLNRHHIALWDVLKSATRESSLDSDIKNPNANDILGFISTHPYLRVIGLNGKAAAKYFRKFIGIHNLPKNVRIVSLPSSSAKNRHHKLDAKIRLWNLFLKSSTQLTVN